MHILTPLLKPRCILSNQNLGLVVKISKLVTAVGAAGYQDFQPVGTIPVKNPKIFILLDASAIATADIVTLTQLFQSPVLLLLLFGKYSPH